MKALTLVSVANAALFWACSDGANITNTAPDASAADAAALDASVADASGPDAGVDASPNELPSISKVSDQVTQFAPVGPIAFVVEDSQTAPEDLVLTATSSNADVLPEENIALDGTGMIRTVTLTPAASGTAMVTLAVNDGITNGFRSFLFTVTNEAPTAAPDSYAAFGNTEITVGAGLGVLANDSDAELDDIEVIADDLVSSLGGSVALAADGSFSYLPPVGVTDQTDTFAYLLSDGFATSTGTASVDLTEMVWYVDSTVPVTGDGRSALPVQTLPEAEAASSTGDIIFVAGESYDEGIRLKDGQRLIGAPIGLEVAGEPLIAPSKTRPVIRNTSAAAIRLGADAEVRGLRIEDSAGDGIVGDAIVRAVIDDVSFLRTGGQAIDLGNPNAAEAITCDISNVDIAGADDFSTTPTGIDVQIDGVLDGRADVQIRNVSIRAVSVGILLAARGETGTGAGGTNSFLVETANISDFDDDGVQIEPDDTAASAFEVRSSTIDGVNLLAATPVRGVDTRLRTAAGASTSIILTDNSISDSELACVSMLGSSVGGGGSVVALLRNNQISSCL